MKTIGLLSGKGGVGKTTTAINLAAGLSYFGKRAIIVDANLTTPNVGLHLGVPTSPNSIHHVLKGKAKIHDAVYRHPSGIHFVPGSLALEDMEQLRLNLFKSVHNLNADYVIIDGAAGLGKEALATMEHCDQLLVVTNPELPAITDALKTVKVAEDLGKNILGVIVTRTKNDAFDVSIRNIEAMLERPVIAVIPEDSALREALAMKDTIIYSHPHAKAARAYLKFAAALCGQELQELPQTWIDRILNVFRRK